MPPRRRQRDTATTTTLLLRPPIRPRLRLHHLRVHRLRLRLLLPGLFVPPTAVLLLALLLLLPAAAEAPGGGGGGGGGGDIRLGALALSRRGSVFERRHIVLAPGASLFLAVRPPQAQQKKGEQEREPAAILVEAVAYPQKLPRDRRPDPLLMAQLHVEPDPFRAPQPPSPLEKPAKSPQPAEPAAVRSVGTTTPLKQPNQLRQPDPAARMTWRRRARRAAESFLAACARGMSHPVSHSPRASTTTRASSSSPSSFSNVFFSDAEAFITWRPFAYILLRNVSAEDVWHVRLLNFNGSVANTLNATVRVTLEVPPAPTLLEKATAGIDAVFPDSWRANRYHGAPSSAAGVADPDVANDNMSHSPTLYIPGAGATLCPRGCDPHRQCSGRGTCQAAACLCRDGYEGRACEARVRDVRDKPFDVPSDQTIYFRYRVPFNCSVATVLRLLPSRSADPGSLSWPMLIVKRKGENGGRLLRRGTPLPTIQDIRFSDRMGFRGHLATQIVVRRGLTEGDTLYTGVLTYQAQALAFFSPGPVKQPPAMRAQLIVFPCNDRRHMANYMFGPGVTSLVASDGLVESDGMRSFGSRGAVFGLIKKNVSFREGLPDCPIRMTSLSWETNVPYMMLPLFLGTITMLTLIVCVTAWARVFRYHFLMVIVGVLMDEDDWPGLGPGQQSFDHLSDAELSFMFPTFSYTKAQSAALSAAGDLSCSVCLSSYEENELLRRLGCGHSYHAECLDPWLRTNASCPRCRKSARIADMPSRTMSRLRFWIRGAVIWCCRMRRVIVRPWRRYSSVEQSGGGDSDLLPLDESPGHRQGVR